MPGPREIPWGPVAAVNKPLGRHRLPSERWVENEFGLVQEVGVMVRVDTAVESDACALTAGVEVETSARSTSGNTVPFPAGCAGALSIYIAAHRGRTPRGPGGAGSSRLASAIPMGTQ